MTEPFSKEAMELAYDMHNEVLSLPPSQWNFERAKLIDAALKERYAAAIADAAKVAREYCNKKPWPHSEGGYWCKAIADEIEALA